MPNNPNIPIAKKQNKIFKNFDDERIDLYSWLRDKSYPKITNNQILNYLKYENNYANNKLKKYFNLTKKIYQEIKNRISENNETTPIKIGNYYYYSYIKKGMNYWVHSRKYKSIASKEKIILDENELAKNKHYCKVKGIDVSPNHELIAYAVDYVGNEKYEIKIKNLKNNQLLNDIIPNTFGKNAWNSNNEGFFYIPAGKNWRANQVFYHKLGESCKNDILLYEEKDITFSLDINKSSSQKYLIIFTDNNEENECHFIYLNKKKLKPLIFCTRRKGYKYFINDYRNKFYILTNDKGKNFRIAETSKKKLMGFWKEFIPYSNIYYIKNFELYKNSIIISSMNIKNGLLNIEIINLNGHFSKKLNFLDKAYQVDTLYTTYYAETMRYSYSSLSTPFIINEFNFKTNQEKVLKNNHIPSRFKSKKYKVKRLYVTSRDKKKVPITLIYRKNKFSFDNNPLYLHGYGSYGISIPLSFRNSILSLINRGFIYVIAHIRGGDDLGCEWYKTAKFLNKKNTFYDFIDVAHFLIKKKYVKYGNISIAGSSAGGMLVGFCANNKSNFFNTVVAHVPFVDVLNTMLDESLPLTFGEYKEWGNPKQKKYYSYIKSYSPYDNVKKQHYPNFFITAGLNDSRVAYWEPAKWVAKLRNNKLDNNTILLKTNMDTGHAGKIGRYTYLKEIAEEYAFLIQNSIKNLN